MTWTACQKEMESGPSNISTTQQEDLTPRIASFVGNAEHHSSGQQENRSTETFDQDSAAWYVEGGLNYSLTQAWLASETRTSDSISYTVPSSGGTVTVSDVEAAYLSLSDSLNALLQPGVNHLIVIDVTPVESTNGLQLKVRYVLGFGEERLGGLNTSYPPGTDLFYMTLAGQNNSCSITYSALGADKTIQGRVNYTIPLLAYGQYYASVETWYIDAFSSQDDFPNHSYSAYSFPNPNNTSGDATQDYADWIWSSGPGSGCIGASNLTYHTQGSYDMMHTIHDAQCPTKSYASCRIDGDEAVGGGSFQWLETYYTYGIPQYHLQPH